MRPLLLFAIIYTVFVGIFKSGGDLPLFGVALLLGIVIFQFFADATSMSIKSLVDGENLIRKIDFPRAAIPVSCVLQALFNFTLNLIPVFIFLIAAGGKIRWGWLELPVIAAILVIFVTGLSLLLSALFVSYRDVDPIWEVIAQALFYGTPILYSISLVIDEVGIDVARLMLANPLAAAIQLPQIPEYRAEEAELELGGCERPSEVPEAPWVAPHRRGPCHLPPDWSIGRRDL